MLYRQILQVDPQHVHALHLIGVIAYQVGKNDQAVEFIQRALAFTLRSPMRTAIWTGPDGPGKGRGVRQVFSTPVHLKPDFAEAYNNLGSALKDQGKLVEAVSSYREALRLKPGFAAPHSNLGNALKDQGKLDEAIGSYQQYEK